MFTLVIGDSASGKSEYAEGLLPAGGTYIATMRPYGKEAQARIARHQSMRRNRGFVTVECYTDLDRVQVNTDSVLIECMGNLTANEVFEGAGDSSAEKIVHGVCTIMTKCRDLVIVTNQVFTAGADYGEETVKYMRILAEINRKLAKMADNVCEIVCGQAVYYKGARP